MSRRASSLMCAGAFATLMEADYRETRAARNISNREKIMNKVGLFSNLEAGIGSISMLLVQQEALYWGSHKCTAA